MARRQKERASERGWKASYSSLPRSFAVTFLRSKRLVSGCRPCQLQRSSEDCTEYVRKYTYVVYVQSSNVYHIARIYIRKEIVIEQP